MTETPIKLSGIGWVLPWDTGSGVAILGAPDWVARDFDNAALDGFRAKPYLRSVKGYLDPASAFCLAAASLALGRHAQEWSAGEIREDAGMSVATRYGACLTGYRFWAQFVQKGPRHASPLLFPHSYPNTAANLSAMEFELGGPHMVLYGPTGPAEALGFALRRLQDGTAANMLVGGYEAAPPRTLPDGVEILHGAIVLWLSSAPAAPNVAALTLEQDVAETLDTWARGSVQSMLALLQTLKPA